MELFSDAEGGEDQVEDVVGGGLAGQGVEGPKGAVEVEQDHLVGDAGVVGAASVFEGGAGGDDGLLLAEVGEEAGFGCGSAGGELKDSFAQHVDSIAGESGGGDRGKRKVYSLRG